MSNLSGATTAVFIVRLSAALEVPVTVAWKTKDGTAKAGTDYEAASGSVTFEPGETEKQIQVSVYGRAEGDTEARTFGIELYPPENAILDQTLTEVDILVTDESGTAVTSLVVATGPRGLKGDPGLSAYELAKLQGYEGTLEDWLQKETAAGNAAEQAEQALTEVREVLDDVDQRIDTATQDVLAQATAAKIGAEAARDQTMAVAQSVGLKPDIATGLAQTTDGQTFSVAQGVDSDIATITYRNDNGTATPIASTLGKAAVDRLAARVAEMLFPGDFANALSGIVDNAEMSPFYVGSDGYVVINTLRIYEEIQRIAALEGKFFNTGADDDFIQVWGWLDNNNALPLYGDKNGHVWLGEGPVNLNEFVKNGGASNELIKNLQKEIDGTGNIICDGDSLTAGAGSATARGYVERLRTRLTPQGITVTKRAVGGQGAQSIATRQGGYVNMLTLENNLIPATRQAVNIIASTQTPITNQGGGPIRGTLLGVPGVVAATFSGTTRLTYTFTRDADGEAKYVDPVTPFIKEEDGHEYDINIIWLGRNNTADPNLTSIVLDAAEACIAHLKAKNKRFVVMSILNGDYSNEYVGGAVYDRIMAANAALQARWPENFLNVRGPLVRSYNPDNPQDVIDFGHDIPPSSLRNDNIHLNDSGYDIVEELVYNFIKSKGWVQ